MTPVRVVFLVAGIAVLAGSGYLSWAGVWRESGDLDRSVRVGSPGGGFGTGGRVK